jgi:CheY-like chemotaxis protein
MTLVLVIDDDQSVCAAVHAALQRRGIGVIVADNGATGVRYLETFAVDVAIVDIFMPDMDGLEIIRTFSQRTPRVPIIAMSGLLARDRYETAPDFLRMAGMLGAAFCLRKPFPPHQLMTAIEVCLGAPLDEPSHDAMAISNGEHIGGERREALQVLGCAAGIGPLEV